MTLKLRGFDIHDGAIEMLVVEIEAAAGGAATPRK